MSSPEGDEHLVAFSIDAGLERRIREVLESIRQAEDKTAHAREVAEIVVEMTRTGLDYYYLLPLEQARVGFVDLNAARVGIASAGRSLPLIVNRILRNLSSDQLQVVADHVESVSHSEYRRLL